MAKDAEATGTLTIADPDSPLTFVQQIDTVGTGGYGKFSITEDGDWTYTANTAHNDFVDGEIYTDSIAVSSVDAAKLYYESFRKLQQDSTRPLRVATIFSFAANEERATPWIDPVTYASGLRVPSPLGDRLLLRVLRETNGLAGTASESEIREWTLRLATATGIDAAGLEATVREYNTGAVKGVDEQHARGTTAFNRYLADPNHQPNPCVAPVQTGPFYAVKLIMGDLGTFDGIQTSVVGEVLKRDGRPIAGLYAVGNDRASIMGGNYPGAGITHGPNMTFGYVTGNHIADTAGARA